MSSTVYFLRLVLCTILLHAVVHYGTSFSAGNPPEWASENDALAWTKSLDSHEAILSSGVIEKGVAEGWLNLMDDLVRRSSAKDGTVVARILRTSLLGIQHQIATLLRVLDTVESVEKTPDVVRTTAAPEIIRVSPAFQWAESDTHIYLQVKLSYRWSSPGALSVQQENVTLTPTHVAFSGIGRHSTVQKYYALDLPLFSTIVPEESDWTWGSVGKLSITLKKEAFGRWPRLLNSTLKVSNMHVWLEMEDKLNAIQTASRNTTSTTAQPSVTASLASQENSTSDQRLKDEEL